jgi:hypothetical protein
MARDARVVFGGGDSGSLLGAAISLREQHLISADFLWVYNFWPPGLVVIYAAMVWIEDATFFPFALQMILFTGAIWAVFIGTFFRFFRRMHGLATAIVFAVAMFLSTAMTSWGTGAGVFYGDSFGAIAMCFSLLAMIKVSMSVRRSERALYASVAGAFLAAAAYFRAIFELVATGTAVIAVLVVIASLITAKVRAVPKSSLDSFRLGIPLLIASGVAQLMMLPWRVIANAVVRPGDLRWSTVSSLASPARWIPTSRLRSEGVGWAADGHSNWSCINDPVRCEEIFLLEVSSASPYSSGTGGYFSPAEFNALTITSALERPFVVIAERLGSVGFGFASDTGGAVKDLALPESILLAVAFISLVVVALRARKITQAAYVLFLISVGVQLAVLLILHQEPRYYMTIEMTTIVMAFYTLGGRTPRSQLKEATLRREPLIPLAPARPTKEHTPTQ